MAAPNWKPPKPAKDPAYLRWLLYMPCAKCGREGWEDENGRRQGIVVHHQPAVGDAAVGRRVSDRRGISLCCNTIRGGGCHELYSQIGRHSFWGDYDVEALILRLNKIYDTIIAPLN